MRRAGWGVMGMVLTLGLAGAGEAADQIKIAVVDQQAVVGRSVSGSGRSRR